MKDPQGITELLEEKGKEVDLDEKGTGSGGKNEVEIGQNESKLFTALGVDKEALEKYDKGDLTDMDVAGIIQKNQAK